VARYRKALDWPSFSASVGKSLPQCLLDLPPAEGHGAQSAPTWPRSAGLAGKTLLIHILRPTRVAATTSTTSVAKLAAGPSPPDRRGDRRAITLKRAEGDHATSFRGAKSTRSSPPGSRCSEGSTRAPIPGEWPT